MHALALSYYIDRSNCILQTYILAVNSENTVISKAATYLSGASWPSAVQVSNGYFLQTHLYTDDTPGLFWYVVVAVPVNTIAPTSTTTKAPTVAPTKVATTKPTSAPTKAPTGKPK